MVKVQPWKKYSHLSPEWRRQKRQFSLQVKQVQGKICWLKRCTKLQSGLGSQLSEGGTLYFPELADIPPVIQHRLLHYIDTGCIIPAGGKNDIPVRVHLVIATSHNPEQLAEDGGLITELLHRLNAVRIQLPPLRERLGDSDFLLHHFLQIYAGRLHKQVKGFSRNVLKALAEYPYPGNIRELKNIVEYAVMVCPGEVIEDISMPGYLTTYMESCGRPTPKSKPQNRKKI